MDINLPNILLVIIFNVVKELNHQVVVIFLLWFNNHVFINITLLVFYLIILL